MALDTKKFEKVIITGTAELKLFEAIEQEKVITAKYEALGGAARLGQPLEKKARIWTFNGHAIVYNKALKAAFHVMGAIYAKWIDRGGLKWGEPNTDELATADGVGRFNHFNGDTASIFWHPHTGAWAIYGDIRKRWAALGWERGYLGYPTSDEDDLDEGGRGNAFQHGQIYWWPDTGAIDMRGVVIHYTGFYAHKESDWDQGSGSDEPYAVFSVVAPKRAPYSVRTQVYSGVDDRSSRPDLLEIYRGPAWGVVVKVTAMERDHGDPEKVRQKIQSMWVANHEVGKFALEHIPLVGPALSKLAAALLDDVMPDVGNAIADLLNMGDDTIGVHVFQLRTKQLVMLATRTPNSVFKGIGYKVQSGMMKRGGAEYRVYLGVVPA
jgi:hypothetical protein